MRMDQLPELTRVLYCGDNLPVLRESIADESVDLVYLDPPFYSQRNYRAFFKRVPVVADGHARASAFEDTWRWGPETEQMYAELAGCAPAVVARALGMLRELLGAGSLLAYLAMMAARLLELRRVLKPTGSLYLHCDPAASHYLKLLLDAIFGAANFHNEIVWFYKTGGASSRHFARKHDLIFFYSKSEDYIFHALKEKSYMMHRYGFKKSEFLRDERGEYTWVYMKDVWDLPALGAADGQRLGYPTQKPEALLERILRASSDEGGIVLDPFCGSGTTLAVAQRMGRGWIGIENHYLGVAYQRYRLARAFPNVCYPCIGGPATLDEARRLAHADAAQFRWWALSLLGARPVGGENPGSAEQGVAGVHGILPGRAGDQPDMLIVVLIDTFEIEVVQHLRELVTTGAGVSGLVITLEAIAPDFLATRLRPIGPSREMPALNVITIAELLQQSTLQETIALIRAS